MSYSISFWVKVEGINEYIKVGQCDANTTWNVRDMIVASTGLEWKNDANNGRCVDVIPAIQNGLLELRRHPEKYKQYEAENGWGTVESTIGFFCDIIIAWDDLCDTYPKLKDAATFWIT